MGARELDTVAVNRWLENDELFREQYALGAQHSARVARELLAAGVWVEEPEQRLRENVRDRKKYSDDGDLLIKRVCPSTNTPWGEPLIVEVKSRNLQFTSPADYRYPTVFVNTTHAWDGRERKGKAPVAVLITSQKTGATLAIPAKSKPSWETVTKEDRMRKMELTWYACPKSQLISFEGFVDWVRTSPF